MGNNWVFFIDLDGGSPYILPVEPFSSHRFGDHLFSHISFFMDNSLYQSRNLYLAGSLALQEAFNCFSKIAGALFLWCSSTSSANMTREIAGDLHGSNSRSVKNLTEVRSIRSGRIGSRGFHFSFNLGMKHSKPFFLGKIGGFATRLLGKEAGRQQLHPLLSVAAALVPPLNNLASRSSDVIAVPLENNELHVHGCTEQKPCEVAYGAPAGLTFPDVNWTRHAIEPQTGIEFPVVLDNILSGENNSSLSSEVLVGTGSRIVKIVKIKSLKVYAFGFYVHPNSVCEKLGPKYASSSADELNERRDFYEDLLREDINMTVRLVVNCNGMKINTVRDAFEKSLRARLLKANPETDYDCVRTFGSLFTKDIPLPLGTTIDFRQTADGQLITEMGGTLIGAVRSKELCRAFFDVYLGDFPVSEETKKEIGRNVASLIGRC
ncbi:fatty-acid-binding protein 2 isoform X1 [Cucurbita moschata]|uniref:Fatty-acid-binding protein 2 isoform X1 n=1 Tax=Cucurbita moschata TaxID=3662 RepID=A0A6J1FN23_CUCMO|nr:fatty-acid-binding protein 2 isoform X1 [Cucurbita moschata]XP_022941339.1 fatty-acid-binding protein 2 isoform X1 [Cucurbita moschata]